MTCVTAGILVSLIPVPALRRVSFDPFADSEGARRFGSSGGYGVHCRRARAFVEEMPSAVSSVGLAKARGCRQRHLHIAMDRAALGYSTG
jgi:hypothetical protein